MKQSLFLLIFSFLGAAANAYPTYQCDAPNNEKYLVTLGGKQAIVKRFRACKEIATSVAGHDGGSDLKSVFPHVLDPNHQSHLHKNEHRLFLQPVSGIKFQKFEDESIKIEGIKCRYVGYSGVVEVKFDPCTPDDPTHLAY